MMAKHLIKKVKKNKIKPHEKITDPNTFLPFTSLQILIFLCDRNILAEVFRMILTGRGVRVAKR